MLDMTTATDAEITGQLTEAGDAMVSHVEKRSVILVVTARKYGTQRTQEVKGETAQADEVRGVITDAKASRVKASRKILESETLKKIHALDVATRSRLDAFVFSSKIADGLYMVPLGCVARCQEILKEARPKRAELVEKFLAEYADLVEQARIDLASLFNPGDYEPVEKVRSKFVFAWRYLPGSTGTGELQEVSGDLFEEQRAEARVQLASALEEARMALRKGFTDVVGALAERLTPGPDGKPKTFHASTVDNVVSFLEIFEARNLTGDADLAKLVASAKALLTGVDAKDLRKNEELRTAMAAETSTLIEAVKSLPVVTLVRKIKL